MTRLAATFTRLAAASEGAFVPFLVAGDPDQARSLDLARAVIRAGADILELGFAFSDPPADGPVIQAADVRALAKGANTRRSFELIEQVRAESDVPIALLVYYNLIMKHGVDAFYARCAASGVDAVLVADLPVEEAGPACDAARAHGVAPVFIATSLTPDARLSRVLARAEGYVYYVTHLGVTGARAHVDEGMAASIARVRHHTALPVLAGFGISSAEQVRRVLDAGADGAIVGSALISVLAEHLDDPVPAVEAFSRQLKAATRRSA